MSNEVPPKTKRKIAKGVVVVPSLLTAGGLFAGFFSIIFSFQTEFAYAGIAIIIATILDGLDGRMARLMKVESDFGFQFDSIADMVSFGVAPSVLIFASALEPLGRWGLLGAFLFVACAGVRLARFNVLSESVTGSRKYFKGLASPIAAGGIALTPLIPLPGQGLSLQVPLLIYTLLLSLLMVSNVRFRSFKELEGARRRPIRSFLFLLLLVILVITFLQYALLGIFATYLLWGLSEEVVLFRRRRRSDPNVPLVPFGDRDEDEDSSIGLEDEESTQ